MAQPLPRAARDGASAHPAHPADLPATAILPGANDDGVPTHTSEEQARVERMCEELTRPWAEGARPEDARLLRASHARAMLENLDGLPGGFRSLDASRPWLVYWILHGLELLGELPEPTVCARVADFLSRCQHPDGGFGGGPGQLAHLAPTYAAVMSLAIVGTGEALAAVDRPAMARFLARCKRPDGSFAVHDRGEADTRGTYCALATASLLGIVTPALSRGAGEWLARCQTYEGGMGAEPYGNEAHCGYTYCGLAAAVLLGEEARLDLPLLRRWAAQRQMPREGGFQGRTNKLVDSCYSFWCGALFPLLASVAAAPGSPPFPPWAMSAGHLERYVLLCCQDRSGHGGLKDKPGKHADPYHTCYALSGLSVAQHAPNGRGGAASLGRGGNLLRATSPLYNISPEAVARAMEWYAAH